MGIKRKKLGPQPVSEKPDWQKLADDGHTARAITSYWRAANCTAIEAGQVVREYIRSKRKC